MEKKGRHLAGIEILETKDIQKATFEVTEKFSRQVRDKFDNLTAEVGQTRLILVATVEGTLVVVDGNKYLKQVKKLNLTHIYCKSLGNISKKEYVLMRLLLNIHSTRLTYVDIAKIVSQISEQPIDNKRISNKTGIPLADVERYSTLLDFNWEMFEKEEINLQFDPFDNLIEKI